MPRSLRSIRWLCPWRRLVTGGLRDAYQQHADRRIRVVANRPADRLPVANEGPGGSRVLAVVRNDRPLALQDDEDLLLAARGLVVRGQLASRLDLDDVEAERVGAQGLPRQMPGAAPGSLHRVKVLPALDRVPLGHQSSSVGLPWDAADLTLVVWGRPTRPHP